MYDIYMETCITVRSVQEQKRGRDSHAWPETATNQDCNERHPRFSISAKDRKANGLPRIEKGGRRAKARCPKIKLKIDESTVEEKVISMKETGSASEIRKQQ